MQNSLWGSLEGLQTTALVAVDWERCTRHIKMPRAEETHGGFQHEP